MKNHILQRKDDPLGLKKEIKPHPKDPPPEKQIHRNVSILQERSEGDVHEDTKNKASSERDVELMYITEESRWRINRHQLLLESNKRGIYPHIVEKEIPCRIQELKKRILMVNYYIDDEVANVASIISTMFYLLHRSQDYPIHRIILASTSLASKLSGSCARDIRMYWMWKRVLSDKEQENLEFDEFNIMSTLGSHLNSIEDPVKLVENLCNDAKMPYYINERAKIIAQEKLEDQFLVQSSLSMDLAIYSLKEAIQMNAAFQSQNKLNQMPPPTTFKGIDQPSKIKAPYKCDICGKCFGRQKTRLKNHIQKCDEKHSKGTYNSDCGKVYLSRSSLIRHLNTPEHINNLCGKRYSECKDRNTL